MQCSPSSRSQSIVLSDVGAAARLYSGPDSAVCIRIVVVSRLSLLRYSRSTSTTFDARPSLGSNHHRPFPTNTPFAMIDTPDPAKTGMTSPVDPALQFSDREIRKLQSYTSALPYTIESNDEMQYILDLYLTRIAQVCRWSRPVAQLPTTPQQCIEAKDYDPGFLQWDSMLNYWRES